MKKSCLLIGMMGSGKSTVGPELSKLLSLPFLDLDQEIEKEQGLRIQDIFAAKDLGEGHFRCLERAKLMGLLKSGPFVIALGGGAWWALQADIRAEILAHHWVVHLKARITALMERLEKDTTRPLLKGKDGDEKRGILLGLWEKRRESYLEAPIQVSVENKSAPQIAQEISRHLAP